MIIAIVIIIIIITILVEDGQKWKLDFSAEISKCCRISSLSHVHSHIPCFTMMMMVRMTRLVTMMIDGRLRRREKLRPTAAPSPSDVSSEHDRDDDHHHYDDGYLHGDDRDNDRKRNRPKRSRYGVLQIPQRKGKRTLQQHPDELCSV